MHIKHIIIGAALTLIGCGHNPTAPDHGERPNGFLRSEITLGRVGALSKTAAINLSKVRIVAVSSASDTSITEVSVSGNSQVTIMPILSLKPLRDWTLSVSSYDSRDSIIHTGSSGSIRILPGDTSVTSLNLGSRYTMCQVSLTPPTQLSAVGTSVKDTAKITRFVLKVDNVVRADSLVASGFTNGVPVVLGFDYAASGVQHTVSIEVTGTLHSYTGLLYSGSTNFNLSAGADSSSSFNLDWAGPTTGSGKITVILGRVGKASITGTMPGTIIQ